DFSSIYWTYASGFPKAMNISKGVDKKLGADAPETKALDGAYAGFQPKPAVEIVIVAMKPLAEGSYIDQVLANGKGVTWLDDCRIPYKNDKDIEDSKGNFKPLTNYDGRNTNFEFGIEKVDSHQNSQGRFPANILVCDDALNDGVVRKGGGSIVTPPSARYSGLTYNGGKESEGGDRNPFDGYDDEGSASRYFDLDAWWEERIKSMDPAVLETFPFLLVPKASTSEKNAGLDDVEAQYMDGSRKVGSPGGTNPRNRGAQSPRKNFHPTVKPVKLFTYLITLGSRKGDVVLDPFGGSGTTGVAAEISERDYILFEMEQDFHELACKRIEFQQAITKKKNASPLSDIFKRKC
ncbi:MAG: site-specific DNA-methyltransferase, partial [Candidatus Omnitrophica bacterium]|nr:site-specific DNA-methyltransferase [Candidatus Omnitrophota bacterium]